MSNAKNAKRTNNRTQQDTVKIESYLYTLEVNMDKYQIDRCAWTYLKEGEEGKA